MRWSWLANRFVVTFGGALVLAGLWNLYIAFNDDGRITGRVVGPDGQPVEGAAVVLSERTLLVAQPKGNTETGPDGSFRFDGHRLHRIYIEARKPDVGRYGPREFRLYFKGENLDLEEPLRLAGS
ncbi:MAG: carboxypeptidase-like regulatory domain-containing protein [Rhizobiaceae bacterium]|nr:carboxypeptidase-like regulatory domain-containing protein [Rhizobiaceae bacterium]MCV0408198.1 carboxypeptidase-like regulatory domain-containing protein [Rhizobiaceae bacterium]